MIPQDSLVGAESSERLDGYSKDYAVVLKGDEERVQEIVGRLSSFFEVAQQATVRDDKTIVLLRMPLPLLVAHASTMGLTMLLDEYRLKDVADTGEVPGANDTMYNVAPFSIQEDPSITKIGAFQHIYARFSGRTAHLMACADSLSHPFEARYRIQVIVSFIRAKLGFNLDRMPEVAAHFPLRESQLATDLVDNWMSYPVLMRPWSLQPLRGIVSYLGTRIAFYFALCGHVAGWLALAQVLFVPVFLRAVVVRGVEGQQLEWSLDLWYFAVVAPLWGLACLLHWRRTRPRHALALGMGDVVNTVGPGLVPHKAREAGLSGGEGDRDDSFVDEPDDSAGTLEGGDIHSPGLVASGERFDYQGLEVVWPGDNTVRRMAPRNKGLLAFALSAAIVYIGMSLVIITAVIMNDAKMIFGGFLVNVTVGVTASVLLDVGLYTCTVLTRRENHRTNGEYETALFCKFLPLSLLVVLWPVAYVAIFKPLMGIQCYGSGNMAHGVPECLSELSTSVPVLVTAFMVSEHFRDMLVPVMWPQVRRATRWLRLIMKNTHDRLVLHQHAETLAKARQGPMEEFGEPERPPCGGQSDEDEDNAIAGTKEDVDARQCGEMENGETQSLLGGNTGVLSGVADSYGAVNTPERARAPPPTSAGTAAHHHVLMRSPLHGPLTSLVERDKEEEEAERAEAELLKKMSWAELELTKAPHDPTTFALRTAVRTAAHFAFVCIFAGVYPLAPALCYVSVLVGIHTEANMLLFRTRRPQPQEGGYATRHYQALVAAWVVSVVLVVGLAAAADVCYAKDQAAAAAAATFASAGGAAGSNDGALADTGAEDDGSIQDYTSRFILQRHPLVKFLVVSYAMWALGALVLLWDVTPGSVRIQEERQRFLNKKLGLFEPAGPPSRGALAAYDSSSQLYSTADSSIVIA